MARYFGHLSDAQYHRSLVEARAHARASNPDKEIQTMPTPTTTQPAADRISAAEIRAAFAALEERESATHATVETLAAIVDALTQETRELREAMAGQFASLATQLAAQPTPAPITAAAGYIDFHADALYTGMDDNGKISYKAKGGQYQKFGIRVWPETLPLLGIDAASLTPGQPYPLGVSLRAELGDGGMPRKVTGLTPGQPPATPQPPATTGKTTPPAASAPDPILPTGKPASRRPRQALDDF